MENNGESLPEPKRDESSATSAEILYYPPKYRKPEQTQNIWVRSITSLALYLALGYFIFKQWEVLLLVTAIVMIHELGHFFAMKYYGYNDLGIFFIPLLGAYVSGTKRDVSQKQSAVILLAGPLPGIVLGMIFYLLDRQGGGLFLFDMSFTRVGLLFIILNVINLLPVYPLDGGQLLNRVFLDEESHWSKLFIVISVGLIGWFSVSKYLSTGSPFYFILLLFPLTMLYRLFGEKKMIGIEKKIETEGIYLDVDYDELPDADYWKIRRVLLEEHPSFKDVPAAPPFIFHEKEEKIMTAIQNLLHRHLIQDISIAGKLLVAAIWLAAFLAPWWLNMYVFIFDGRIPQ